MEKLLNAIEKTIVELRQGQDDGLNLYKKNYASSLGCYFRTYRYC